MLISRANLKILNDFKILDITPRSKNFGSYLHKFPSNLIWLENFIFKIWIYLHPRALVLSGTIFHLMHIYNCLDNSCSILQMTCILSYKSKWATLAGAFTLYSTFALVAH